MIRLLYTILFFLIAFMLGECRKSSVVEQQAVFVKLFPTDSSYKTGGCFQLPDGNYVIYGYDPDNAGVLPLIIKSDKSGKIIWKKKLPSPFHLLTIKPISNGNMLAVGADKSSGDSENVCMIDPEGRTIFSTSFLIPGLSITSDQLPDFVEEENGDFTITGFVFVQRYSSPFVFRIASNGIPMGPFRRYDSLMNFSNLRPVGITSRNDGYSIGGGIVNADSSFRGMFLIRITSEYELAGQTILFDHNANLTGSGISEDRNDGSTVICGECNGQGFSGILYVRKVDSSGNVANKILFTDYENLAIFNRISKTSDGGYILVGTVNRIGDPDLVSYAKIYLLKLDANLHEQWSRQFNSINPYMAVSVVQTLDGGYLIGGYENTESYVFTMIMIKTDAMGNIVPDL